MKFKGDIIITDPCYIMKDSGYNYWNDSTYPKWDDFHKDENGVVYTFIDSNGNACKGYDSKRLDKESDFRKAFNKNTAAMNKAESKWKSENPEKVIRDWERCNYGQNMKVFGITNYLCRDTIYGDWSCHKFNSDIGKCEEGILGKFCADAGMVAVFLLDEVLKYNHDFDYHINRKWTTTHIEDFDGDVEIKVIESQYEDEETGEMKTDKEVSVIGKGNVNFFTTQTGF